MTTALPDWIAAWRTRPELPDIEPWRLRWCAICRQWEKDAGPPLGWVPVVREGGK